MKMRISTFAAAFGLLLAVTSLGAASMTQAAGKPGFLPGTWIGNGAITGSLTNGRVSTALRGPIRFKLGVDKKLRVSGSGTWKLQRFAYEGAYHDAADTQLKGWAAIGFAGTSTKVTFSGTQYVIGEVMDSGIQRPIRFERELDGRLVITRARQCELSGRMRVQTGLILSWSAKPKGSGCASA